MDQALASLPPEISSQLDPLNQCRARSIYGQCAYPPVRGENLCLEHTRTPRGLRLRNRLIALLEKNLRAEWNQHQPTAWPNERGAYATNAQAEILARRKAEGGPPTPEDLERIMENEPSQDAILLGQTASQYFTAQDLRDFQAVNDHLLKQKAAAAVREITEIRREQRRELARKQRLEEVGSGAPLPIRFRGDVTTPYGIAAASEGLMHIYAEGRISQRRCETFMRLLRMITVGRMLGAGRPMRVYEPPVPNLTPGQVIDADVRPYLDRRDELQKMRERFFRTRLTSGQLSSAGQGEDGAEPPGPPPLAPEVEPDSTPSGHANPGLPGQSIQGAGHPSGQKPPSDSSNGTAPRTEGKTARLDLQLFDNVEVPPQRCA